MATTALDIYNKALVLMDAQSDADTSEYQIKALPVLNVLRGECYPYSATWEKPESGRAICPVIESLSDVVALDDYICQSVLPYGLGAHLLMEENPSTASFLMQRYNELLNDLKMGRGDRVTGSMDIEDAYSADGQTHYYYNQFSYWGG